MTLFRKINTALHLFKTQRQEFWNVSFEKIGLRFVRECYVKRKFISRARKNGELDSNNVVHLVYHKQPIKMKIYHPNDLLTINLLARRTFSELTELERLSALVPSGAHIVDIGANVGNHTVFFAKVMSGFVYSFEPQHTLFSILKENVRLNSIEDRVALYNIGLSDTAGNASLDGVPKENIGGTSIKKDEEGEMVLDTLDNVLGKIRHRIALLKIDVEGFEYNVLRGAKNILSKHSPLIFVEIWHEHKVNRMLALLAEYGYALQEVLSSPKLSAYIGPNFIFKKLK